MSGLVTMNDDPLTPPDLEQVIEVCDRFGAWNEGRRRADRGTQKCSLPVRCP